MQSIWIRRDRLTRTQRRLLDFVERETFPNRSVVQSAIEQEFREASASELHYRLEQLRLLGFVEREHRASSKTAVYSLAPAYRRELERVGIDRRSYLS